MTAVTVGTPAAVQLQRLERARAWVLDHRLDVSIVAVLLVIVGVAMAWNLYGYPALLNDDEMTYTVQGWNWLRTGQLSHYTYWYDHPPLGWMVIGLYGWLTNGFSRDPYMVMVGREVMWLCTMVSAVLMYALVRRLQFRRVFAVVAVLVFTLSPLGIYMHRMVFLDNLSIMWILAALVFAASPRRSMGAAVGTAMCLAAATLTKETSAIMFPVIVWVLIQHTAKVTRWKNIIVFTVLYVLSVIMTYFLYAILKGELIPGPGHVSLGWSLWYQFIGRAGSGSVFDPTSDTYRLVHVWFGLDAALLWGGIGAALVAVTVSRLRPFALAMGMLVAVVFKGGYMPAPYVISVLPFAAILIAGVADAWWGKMPCVVARRMRKAPRFPLGFWRRLAAIAAFTAVLTTVTPAWASSLHQQASERGYTAEFQAEAWIMSNTTPKNVVVVDDYMWGDLKKTGRNPLWYWKVNGDPQVTRDVLPRGYRSIDYVVLTYQPPSVLDTLPTLREAINHSQVVTRFGEGNLQVTVYRVKTG